MNRKTITLSVENSLAAIGKSQWDACANPGWSVGEDGSVTTVQPAHQAVESDSEHEPPEAESIPQQIPYNPFISYDFLHTLEDSGCADLSTGWYAQHLVMEGSKGGIDAIVPCYLKNHSQGEYVFDYGWADAFERAGGNYYPKLQASVPFTPVTGRRLLIKNTTDAAETTPILAQGLVELTNKMNASSAHLTFLTSGEAALLDKAGFLIRTDQQFHWRNDGYDQFDDFLGALASRKRKAIRRERRDALDSGLTIEWLTGNDITEAHWDAFFSFYMDTGARKWGQPYLDRAFFSMIGERMGKQILLIMARQGDDYIAGALNFIGSHTLYGRYWGCNTHLPFLHFELCYYQAIDFAIAHGMQTVEAGAQGPHKLARGYLPIKTHSAHWITHSGLRDAVAEYLDRERLAVDMDQQAMADYAPFRKS